MIEYLFASIALSFGLIFFLFAARYYLFTATIFLMQLISPLRNGAGNGKAVLSNGLRPKSSGEYLTRISERNLSGGNSSTAHGNGSVDRNANSATNGYRAEPFVSIHIATYNEPNVVERIIASCMSLDYSNYEVIIVDDSTDRTVEILDKWKAAAASSLTASADGGQLQALLTYRRPELKIIHRNDRTGFKGGALNEALRHMDPRAEFVIVLDADFVPSPDLIHQFLNCVPISTIDELFSEVRKLDEDYAAGKIGIAEFLDKREELLVRTVGRRPLHEITTVGSKALRELDRLYGKGAIGLEAYLERRRAILATMELAGVSPLKADPLGERAILVNSFELDQLFAAGKIDLGEYISRRRRRANHDAAVAKTQSLPFRQILELDLAYAEGKISSQDQYLAQRAKLVKAIAVEDDRVLQERFELDQSFAAGKITTAQYLHALEQRGSNGNGSNGNSKRRSILWRGRKNVNGASRKGPSNRNGNGNRDSTDNLNGSRLGQLAAVQGYQWHYLNKSESWLTQGVRAEFSGSYVIERTCQEIFGSMKMIAGSVYMIRADLLRKYGWSTSITEDWELTCRLYRDGYKVAYTPLIQVPAEAPATINRLVRQRQRWAEGHTYNARKYFWEILRSPHLALREKAEFLYFAPYYLQAFFFMIGSGFWLVSEATHEYLPFWTAAFGWSLMLSNLIALPLMNLSGLFAEESAKKDLSGVLSAIVMSYILAPFQGYAAVKGLLEKAEGHWFRTFKTGNITDSITRGKFSKRWSKLKPKSAGAKSPKHAAAGSKILPKLPSGVMPMALVVILTLSLVAIATLAFSVPYSSAIPANTTWYFYSDGGPIATPGTLSETAPSANSQPLAGSTTYYWATTTTYSVSSSDNGNWVFHLVYSSSDYQPNRIITLQIYVSSVRTTLGTQYGSNTLSTNSLNSGGGTIDITIVFTFTGTPGNYYVQFSWSSDATSNKNVAMTTSSVGSTLIVPEGALLLAVLAPFIPIGLSRKTIARALRCKLARARSVIGGDSK